MFEATFEIEVDGFLADLSGRHQAEIQLWCNDHSDFLNVRSSRVGQLQRELESEVAIRESIRDGDQLVVVTERCLKGFERTLLETHLANNGCLSLPPLTYVDGRKRAKVLSLDPASLTGIYDDLRAETDVTVRSKREVRSLHPEVPLVGLDDVFPRFTNRQVEAFRTAQELGYYEIPRRVTTAEIAERIGVERRTAEDHLRRAEKKIADALSNHLSLLQSS